MLCVCVPSLSWQIVDLIFGMQGISPEVEHKMAFLSHLDGIHPA
eukprot:COSAG06_NODE_20463_length_794_cov_2467.103597_2_plen_43_part_01